MKLVYLPWEQSPRMARFGLGHELTYCDQCDEWLTNDQIDHTPRPRRDPYCSTCSNDLLYAKQRYGLYFCTNRYYTKVRMK